MNKNWLIGAKSFKDVVEFSKKINRTVVITRVKMVQ